MINEQVVLKELKSLLDFWLEKAETANRDRIFSEIAINGNVNNEAPVGSMFLGRILYGASIGCKVLRTDKYKILADAAFQKLKNELKNPNGGFYWAKDYQNNILHDAENNNMAQAFVIYGLSEYAALNTDAEPELVEQTKFVLNKLVDSENGGFVDGFNQSWIPEKTQTKALGTHIHLLEAFTKQYILQNNQSLKPVIENLIHIILDKFLIESEKAFLHRTTTNWIPLPNFNWAGHNAEVSWILCQSAKAIKSKALIDECNSKALAIMDKVILEAFDSTGGGVFNELKDNQPVENVKTWWPQAEICLGLMNAWQISGKEYYLEKATKLSSYISHNFIHKSGEWYTELNPDNTPVESQPLVFFWKSLYHNVRYYAELFKYINF